MAEKISEQSVKLPYCPLYGSNVVISEYNKNGECQCLSCNNISGSCYDCSYRDKLVGERTSMVINNCMQCLRQK
ncbi:MAG: hypothetical protein J5608_01930 [Alphaproteobacteria bacterium]|nr:hypothetical protein [Alphaproteobacteria bacterium]